MRVSLYLSLILSMSVESRTGEDGEIPISKVTLPIFQGTKLRGSSPSLKPMRISIDWGAMAVSMRYTRASGV